MKTCTMRTIPWLLAGALMSALALPAVAAADGHGFAWNSRPTQMFGTDDWQPAPLNPEAEVYCSDGTLVDPFNPLCPPGTTLEVRNVTGTSFLYADDPRFAGPATFTFSASFDAMTFEGSASGTWTIDVATCAGSWEGTFHGDRRFVYGQTGLAGMPVWLTRLSLRGVGVDGCVKGLRARGTELVTTITPLPVAYEALEIMIPGLCSTYGCLPEGVFTGQIFGPAPLGADAIDGDD